jgi:hypothetical protein
MSAPVPPRIDPKFSQEDLDRIYRSIQPPDVIKNYTPPAPFPVNPNSTTYNYNNQQWPQGQPETSMTTLLLIGLGVVAVIMLAGGKK